MAFYNCISAKTTADINFVYFCFGVFLGAFMNIPEQNCLFNANQELEYILCSFVLNESVKRCFAVYYCNEIELTTVCPKFDLKPYWRLPLVFARCPRVISITISFSVFPRAWLTSFLKAFLKLPVTKRYLGLVLVLWLYRLSHLAVLDPFNAMEACLKLNDSDRLEM